MRANLPDYLVSALGNASATYESIQARPHPLRGSHTRATQVGKPPPLFPPRFSSHPPRPAPAPSPAAAARTTLRWASSTCPSFRGTASCRQRRTQTQSRTTRWGSRLSTWRSRRRAAGCAKKRAAGCVCLGAVPRAAARTQG